MPMNERVAIVTGAASGIGRATALLFASHGARVVASDVDIDGLEETVQSIISAGGDACPVACDISQPDDVARMVKTAGEQYQRLDYACNNAGIEGKQSNTVDCTLENWKRVMDINLMGTWLCMRSEIPVMLESQKQTASDGCAIVNVSSIAGLVGFGGLPAYVASKHGLNGLTKTAALEFAHEHVRINAVCPGAIQTPMIDRVTHQDKQAETDLISRHPLGRMGTPEEIAELIVWLCSDAASFITGQTIPADGGYVAQ